MIGTTSCNVGHLGGVAPPSARAYAASVQSVVIECRERNNTVAESPTAGERRYRRASMAPPLARVAAGEEEVIISSAGKPLVKLVTYSPPSAPRKPGLLRGKVVIRPGFDDLPPGFEDFAG